MLSVAYRFVWARGGPAESSGPSMISCFVAGHRVGLAGCPAGEQGECVLGRGAGFGKVGDQGGAGAGLDGKGLEGQVEVPDDPMVQQLRAGVVDSHVVGGPPDAELLAAS